jgi:hypothetical protein
MALESTQPLIDRSTGNLPGGKGRPARKADNLTAICVEIVGASTSHYPMDLSTACYWDSFIFCLTFSDLVGWNMKQYVRQLFWK